MIKNAKVKQVQIKREIFKSALVHFEMVLSGY